MIAHRFLASFIFTACLLSACGQGLAPIPSTTPVASPRVLPTSIFPQTPTASLPQPEPTSEEKGTLPAIPETGCPPPEPGDRLNPARVTLGPASGILETKAKGEKLVITGRVLDQDCTSVAGAVLKIWQADAEGVYGPLDDAGKLRCCYLQGILRTGEQGAFEIYTIKPGYYQGEATPPPAHIHIEVELPDNPGFTQGLETEIVFAGDPYLPVNAARPNFIVVTLQKEARQGEEVWTGAGDILLPVDLPEQPTNEARSFNIVPKESQAAYHIREKFADITTITEATGLTRGLEGKIILDQGLTPVVRELELTVDLRELKSDDHLRDEKLYDRWLVTRKYPHAMFEMTRLVNFPSSYQEGQEVAFLLEGNMSIRDQTRQVIFESTAKLEGDTLIANASTTIRMTDYGIQPPNLLGFVKVEDEVRITVEIIARDA